MTLENTAVAKTVLQNNKYYMVDWLKVVVDVSHSPEELNGGLRFDIAKIGDTYSEPMKSYKGLWVASPSYDNQLQIKSKKDGRLEIKGNFGKWLSGQNITGSSDVVGLVYATIKKLAEVSEHITPTQQELDGILMGYFKIDSIDVNKAVMFDTRDEALQYLERLKFHGSYSRFEKKSYSNGVYFGFDSKRKTIKYYHKGNEIAVNKDYQHNLDDVLKILASRMIRCEMRLQWRELNDEGLLNGYNWNTETVKQLIDDAHNQLRLPEPIKFPTDLPTKYRRFISCFKIGELVGSYKTSTIDRMKRDLLRLYGVDLNNMTF